MLLLAYGKEHANLPIHINNKIVNACPVALFALRPLRSHTCLSRHEVIAILSQYRTPTVHSTEFSYQVDLVLLLRPCTGVTTKAMTNPIGKSFDSSRAASSQNYESSSSSDSLYSASSLGKMLGNHPYVPRSIVNSPSAPVRTVTPSRRRAAACRVAPPGPLLH